MENKEVKRHHLPSGLASASKTFLAGDMICLHIMCHYAPEGFTGEADPSPDTPETEISLQCLFSGICSFGGGWKAVRGISPNFKTR
jgi:hypothetical protein